MKQAKRLLYPLCLSLLLAACSGSEVPSSSVASSAPSAAPESPSTSLTMLTVPEGSGLYYNTQSDAGYYEIFQNGSSGCNILYTDFATQTRVFLCSRPECTHRDDSCTSWISNTNGGILLMAYKDNLYFFQTGGPRQNATEEDLMHLWRMDLDGSNRELLYTFDNLHHLTGGIASDGETLYFQVASWSEDLSQRDIKLGAFHLETKEFELLCDLNDVTFIGCSGSELFFTKITKEAAHPETLDDFANNPVSGVNTFQFTALDVNTLEWRDVGSPVPARAPMMEGDRLLWLDGTDFSLQQMNPAGTEVTQITDQLPIDSKTRILTFSANPEAFSVSLPAKDGNTDEMEFYSVDLESGEVGGAPVMFHSSIKDPFPAPIRAEYGDMYLILHHDEQVQDVYYDVDGTAQPAMLNIGRLAMISKQDYWQGNDTSTPITDTVLKGK